MDLLNKTQRKLVKDELIYELQKNDGEFESIDYMEGFSTALIVLPIKADLKLILNRIIEECNQYGDFLNENLIVTNVKILSRGEIIQMLHESQNPEIQDTDFDEPAKE